MKNYLASFCLATTLAIVTAAGIVVAVGESPLVLGDALLAALSVEGIGYSIFYATPMIFTGLSVATSFHCGLFNIGAEGQLYMGSLAIVATLHTIPNLFGPNLPGAIAITLAIACAVLSGSLWGGIAGFFKAWRGSHEVIVTIILNFIAMAIVDYSILYLFKDPISQNPETAEIATHYWIPSLHALLSPMGILFFRATPANSAILLAIACAILLHVYLTKTRLGFEFRSVGHNISAARFSGIRVTWIMATALAVSGGLAAMVGVNEILGSKHRLIQGFSPQYGFTGIAVALLARNHPLGVVATGFLFGVLHNMSRELEFSSSHISKELVLVIQSVLIASVAAGPSLWKTATRFRKFRGY